MPRGISPGRFLFWFRLGQLPPILRAVLDRTGQRHAVLIQAAAHRPAGAAQTGRKIKVWTMLAGHFSVSSTIISPPGMYRGSLCTYSGHHRIGQVSTIRPLTRQPHTIRQLEHRQRKKRWSGQCLLVTPPAPVSLPAAGALRPGGLCIRLPCRCATLHRRWGGGHPDGAAS